MFIHVCRADLEILGKLDLQDQRYGIRFLFESLNLQALKSTLLTINRSCCKFYANDRPNFVLRQ